MATWAGFFKRSEAVISRAEGREAIRADMDPFRLRSLPNDDIYFWSKRIDNSRVVRQSDPAARGEFVSTMGAAILLLALAISIIAPRAALMMEGYKLEALKVERQTLLDQKRDLEVHEAALLSPARLGDLAKASNLTSPGVDQIVHLDGQPVEAMAANRAPAQGVPTTAASQRNH